MSEDYIQITSDNLKIFPAMSSEKISENIAHNRKYIQSAYCTKIENTKEWRQNKTIAIVGGGPSLKETYKELYKYKTIIACGSVHDFLMENYVRPNYTVICDPDPLVLDYIKHATLSGVFIVASQCDKLVFEKLIRSKQQVYIWNAARDKDNEKFFLEDDILIGGGCTVGTRAIIIAYNMGYRNFDLYGFDNCIDENNNSHAYKFQNPEKEQINKILDISVGDVKFRMAEYMVGQIIDFQTILKLIGHETRFTVIGDGAIKTMLELGEKKAKENGI